MRKNTIFILSLAAVLMAASCTKTGAGQKEKELHINAALADQSVVTKQGRPLVGVTTITNGFTYGLFVCQEGTTDKAHAHKNNSYNLKASYNGTYNVWNYYYVSNFSSGAVSSEARDKVTLTARQDAVKADIYAYAPYVEGAYNGGPEAIPYNINYSFYNNTDLNYEFDLMYAVENAGSANKGLDPEADGPLNATFSFRHALSLLRFKITPISSGSLYYSRITATLTPGATVTKLYKSGTFNAITGSFNEEGAVTAESIIQGNIDDVSRYGYFLIVPTEVEDDELYFTFRFEGYGSDLQPFYLKKEHVKHSDGTYGLKGGYIYTFNLTLDNYLYLDGITISEDWTDALLGEEHI